MQENIYKLNQRPLRCNWFKHLISAMVLIIFCVSGDVMAQGTVAVKGKVTAQENGETLPGANIIIKGSTEGTITDLDGNYSINAPAESTLVISSIGFASQEVAVSGRTIIDIQLETDVRALDEVVVVGYGEQPKVTLTGSVASVSGKQLERSPVINLTNSFAGTLPGVTTLNRSGEPGRDNAKIYIRGRSTRDTNLTDNFDPNLPLVLVDNVEYPGWERINANDIESVSVLKDASAAIYGARAANGVILITTKRGAVGKPVISYSFNQGISTPTRVPDMASSAQFADYLNEYLAGQNQPPKYTAEEIQKFADGSDPINYPNVDWYNEVIKDQTPQSQHNLNVRGGAENVQYSVSGSYGHQTGMYIGGSHDFKTYSLRSNIDAKVNEYVKVGFDINAGIDNGNYPPLASSTSSSFLYQLTPAFPTLPVFWQNGLPSPGFVGGNPRITASDATGNHNERALRFQGRANFDITNPWVKGLSVHGFAVFNNNNGLSKLWEKPAYVWNYDPATDVYTRQAAFNSPPAPRLTQSYSNNRNYLLNLRIAYARKFGEHDLSTFLAAEQQEGYATSFSGRRENFATPALDELFAGSLVNQTTTGSSSETARQNIFGRFNYGFKSKYLMEFNFRYDGSANFPEGKRFGFFPGVSAGWRISEEGFMNNLAFVDEMKVRGSYGEIGNDQVPAFQYLSSYTSGGSLGGGYHFGVPKVQGQGLVAGVSPNMNITWEVAKISNLAMDATLWNGLLDFTVEVFKQRRTNILASRGLAVPAFAAITLPDENFGVVENKGIELMVSTTNVIGDISYRVAANVTRARSEIIDIAESPNIPEWQKQTGHVLEALRLYNTLGIFRTQEELDASPKMVGARLGDLIYEDINADGLINASDQLIYDKSNVPEVVFGSQVSVGYKGFSLWANFAGQARAWTHFFITGRVNSNSLEDAIVNRWRPGSMDSKYPRPLTTGYQNSTFWLREAWFVRLKTLELGYDLPKSLLSKVGISSMRVYVNGNNLFTIDKLKWFDPEGISTFGDFYPQSKVYNLGFNVKF
jgi:TonB-dependent starch-binding outer membrane protein SusC